MTIQTLTTIDCTFTVFQQDGDFYAQYFSGSGNWYVNGCRQPVTDPGCLNWQVVEIYSDNGVNVEARPN